MKIFKFLVKNVPFIKQKYQKDMAKARDNFLHDMTKHFTNQTHVLPINGENVKKKFEII